MKKKSSGINKFFYTWVILFLIWLGFTTSFEISEIIAGVFVSFVIAILSYKLFTVKGFNSVTPIKLFYRATHIVLK